MVARRERFGGVLLAAPRNIDVRVLWANRDLVGGRSVPSTWTELRESGLAFGFPGRESGLFGTFFEIVTVHGGLYRAISFGRHALYADPFDREDLGIIMAKVFRHPGLRERLARMGAHKARSLFTWTGIAQQLISLIEERATALAFTDNEWDEPWNDGD